MVLCDLGNASILAAVAWSGGVPDDLKDSVVEPSARA
jgi:hypothetical protein